MKKLKLAILGSTNGTDMLALIDAIRDKRMAASIDIVISNKQNAGILAKAKQNQIENVFLDPAGLDREQYDKALAELLKKHNVDLIVLIGYMRILTNHMIKQWPNKIINVHPSLLPAFAGGMDLNVHSQVLQTGMHETGCTVHIVTEEVDSGPILLQKRCEVKADDTVETVKSRVQQLEGDALIEVINTMNENVIPIKRALISVSDKTGIVELAQVLHENGVEIISTGGTSKLLREKNIPVKDVSDVTQFPEMMDGRLKTLHPKIHGGILGIRDQHAEVAKLHDINWIDLVVVNLYPFADTIKKIDVTLNEAIENIDIGGPTMIRSAAKNYSWVGVVVNPEDYALVMDEIVKKSGLSSQTRQELSQKAFQHTGEYDNLISNYLAQQTGTATFPETLNLHYEKFSKLRYGENPHQSATAYIDKNVPGILSAKLHQGKELSFNNIVDADAAVSCLKEFSTPACVVVKHANPCGVATKDTIQQAFADAFAADNVSAFGGIVALNRVCDEALAATLQKIFIEVLIAPEFTAKALEILNSKPNLRVIEYQASSHAAALEYKFVNGALLVQDQDQDRITEDDLHIVTKTKPTAQQIQTLLFAWRVLKYIKSNAILIAKDNVTVGIGAGQVSRIDAVNIALQKSHDLTDTVLASDAFFPFRDSIDKIAATPIRAIIQPGGSVKDAEVIQACDENNIAMVFTGKRCFKH